MLLRTLFLLLFSSQVYSAEITIGVDLDLSIDTIKYVDPEDPEDPGVDEIVDEIVDEPAYVNLVMASCPDIEAGFNSIDVQVGENEFQMLSALGFSVKKESVEYTGSEFVEFSSHYDGAWSIYDDVNQKLIRNWDEECPQAPRDIILDTNIQDVDFVRLYRELNTIYIDRFSPINYFITLDKNSDLDWIFHFDSVRFTILKTLNNKTYAKITGGTDTGLWELKPEIKKLMTTSAESKDSIIQTNHGLVGFSVDPPIDGSIKLQWLEKDTKKTYSFTAPLANSYELYPMLNGTVLVADTENGFKFQWLNHGEKERIIPVPAQVSQFYGCHFSSNNLFCFDSRDNDEVFIWRLNLPFFGEPVFVLDSIVEANVIPVNAGIIDIFFLDGYRVLLTKREGENGVVIINSEESEYFKVANDFSYLKTKDDFNQYLNLTDNLFTVLTLKQNSLPTIVRSIVAGDVLDDEPVVELPEEPVDEPTEEVLEEREDTSSEEEEPRPRAELSGAISMYYLFAMMLVLLVGRRKA